MPRTGQRDHLGRIAHTQCDNRFGQSRRCARRDTVGRRDHLREQKDIGRRPIRGCIDRPLRIGCFQGRTSLRSAQSGQLAPSLGVSDIPQGGEGRDVGAVSVRACRFFFVVRRDCEAAMRSGEGMPDGVVEQTRIGVCDGWTGHPRILAEPGRSGRDQAQGNRVDAVALVRRSRVALTFENMAQMTVAVGAQHLDARRTQRVVGTQDHRVGVRRIEE